MHYYNDNDPYCCEWLRNLIDAGELPAGDVDDRSITDVRPSDLDGYTQCHFFAGVGGWPLALRLAGVPHDATIWTGSCPCQPFSSAGKGGGTDDERHLWPAFRWLVAQRRPPAVFGEQVASKGGRAWLAGVQADLEALGYAVGAADLCAASLGAPHIRQRLFWVADAGCRKSGAITGNTSQVRTTQEGQVRETNMPDVSGERGETGGLADAQCIQQGLRSGQEPPTEQRRNRPAINRTTNGLVYSHNPGPHAGRGATEATGYGGAAQPASSWDNASPILCRDGKTRRISAQPGDEPLAYGIPRDVGQRFPELAGMAKAARRNRIGRLRGYGNAIVPELAAEFLLAYLDTTTREMSDE